MFKDTRARRRIRAHADLLSVPDVTLYAAYSMMAKQPIIKLHQPSRQIAPLFVWHPLQEPTINRQRKAQP